MKNKSFLALFITVALIAVQFTALTPVSAADGDINDIPAYPDYAAVGDPQTTVSDYWGSFEKLGENSRMELSAPVNIDGTDIVEFDLFVNDINDFNEAAALGGEKHDLRFKIGSEGASGLGGNYIAVNVEDKVKASGWNHITAVWNKNISPNDRYDGSFQGTVHTDAINTVGLWWGNNRSEDLPAAGSGLRASKFKIANVCFTVLEINRIPAYPDYAVTGDPETTKSDWWGSFSGLANNSKMSLASPVNVDGTELVEFDLYVKNIDDFNEAAKLNGQNHDLRFKFGSQGTSGLGGNYIAVNIENKVTKSGWNHIVATWKNSLSPNDRYSGSYLGTVDTTAINAVSLFWGNNASGSLPASGTGLRASQFKIANVCFTMREIMRAPAYPDYALAGDPEIIKSDWWGSFSGLADNSKIAFTSPVDVTGTELVEFDLYVKNIDDFNEAANLNGQSHDLRFRFGSRGTGKIGDDYIAVNVQDKVIKSGWNHISAIWSPKSADPDTDRYAYIGTVDTAAVNAVQLYWGSNTSTDLPAKDNALRSSEFCIANVCFAKKEINRVPQYPENAIVEISETGVSTTWGDKYNYTVDRLYAPTVAASVNIAIFDNIEFDIYIKDCAAFKTAATGKSLRFIAGSGDSRVKDRVAYDIEEQITKDGWNHITLKKDSPDVNESVDFSALKVVALAFWNGFGVDNPIGGTAVRIANICATGLEAPEVTVEGRIDFIGSVAKSVRFDAEGAYSAALDGTADISSEKSLEIDVFIPNATSAFTIELADNDGGYALYKFSDLKSGWNHLSVNLSKGVDDDGRPPVIDFTHITGYTFYGAKNLQVFAANFYASPEEINHTPGDINMDTAVDNRDLSALFRYLTGLNAENKLDINALDVNGDGLVNNKDFTRLFKYLSDYNVRIY